VGVGVDDEGGAHFQGHPGHVAVGQTVAFAAESSRKTPRSRAREASSRVMRPGWARMSTSASMAARLVPGATGSARLSPWTTMRGHPQGPGLGGQGSDEGRGQVGELQAGDKHRVVAPVEAQGRGFQAGKDHLEVGGIHVVGNGEKAVALYLGPPPELGRNQLAVAIQGMGMEVYHKGGFSFLVFRF